MRRRALALPLAAALLLSGCGSVFEKEYYYAAPFSEEVRPEDGGADGISNINMLKSVLIDLINRHEEHASLRFSHYSGSVTDDLAKTTLELISSNPLAAFAVDSLTCDTSRIVSYYTADVSISYRRSAEEINAVVGVQSLPKLRADLLETVAAASPRAAFRVYSSLVDPAYFQDTLQELHFSDPALVVTQPRAQIDCYPAEGINRIYDLWLEYGAEAAELEQMRARIAQRIGELTAGLTAATQPKLALECANALFAGLNADAGSYPDTAYGALWEGCADSKGVALAYKALCDAAGIECLVVQGNIGSMEAEERYWNILGLEGAYYHADISAFVWGDRAAAFLLDDTILWGTYLWDTEKYPACNGLLRYRDLVPPPPPPPPAQPEETPPPTVPPALDFPPDTGLSGDGTPDGGGQSYFPAPTDPPPDSQDAQPDQPSPPDPIPDVPEPAGDPDAPPPYDPPAAYPGAEAPAFAPPAQEASPDN